MSCPQGASYSRQQTCVGAMTLRIRAPSGLMRGSRQQVYSTDLVGAQLTLPAQPKLGGGILFPVYRSFSPAYPPRTKHSPQAGPRRRYPACHRPAPDRTDRQSARQPADRAVANGGQPFARPMFNRQSSLPQRAIHRYAGSKGCREARYRAGSLFLLAESQCMGAGSCKYHRSPRRRRSNTVATTLFPRL